MNYNNYIVTVNENGEPYIAHAYATDGKGKNSAQGRRNHKYIMRVRDGLKWRYFYDVSEYESYMRKLRDSHPLKYKTIKNASFRDKSSIVQANPESDRLFSEKELEQIDRITDRKRELARRNYYEALQKADRIIKSKSATPQLKREARKELREARREYELFTDLGF